jgi:hypothetical protein
MVPEHILRIAQSNFPGFKNLTPKAQNNQQFAPPAPASDVAPEEFEERAPTPRAPTRQWAALPPGVTDNDLRQAALAIKEKLIDKFGSLTKAFRAMDEDASGTVTVEELFRYLEIINLNNMRKDVVSVLFERIDADESGCFDFKEFARVMNAGDVMKMEAIADKFDGYEAKRLEAEAAEAAMWQARAAQVGGNKMVLGTSSEDQKEVLRDKWGKRIKGPLQAHMA